LGGTPYIIIRGIEIDRGSVLPFAVSTFDIEHSAEQIEVFHFLLALEKPLNHQAAEPVNSSSHHAIPQT
jgi:hypothetical protein